MKYTVFILIGFVFAQSRLITIEKPDLRAETTFIGGMIQQNKLICLDFGGGSALSMPSTWIVIRDLSGKIIKKFGSGFSGNGPFEFLSVQGLMHVPQEKRIYVFDSKQYRIHIFDENLIPIKMKSTGGVLPFMQWGKEKNIIYFGKTVDSEMAPWIHYLDIGQRTAVVTKNILDVKRIAYTAHANTPVFIPDKGWLVWYPFDSQTWLIKNGIIKPYKKIQLKNTLFMPDPKKNPLIANVIHQEKLDAYFDSMRSILYVMPLKEERLATVYQIDNGTTIEVVNKKNIIVFERQFEGIDIMSCYSNQQEELYITYSPLNKKTDDDYQTKMMEIHIK